MKWVEWEPPERYTSPHRTFEWDLTCKRGLCKCNWVKDLDTILDYLVDSKSNDRSPIENRRGQDTEKTMWRWRQRFEWCICRPKEHKGFLATPSVRREAWSAFSLRAFRRNQRCQHNFFLILFIYYLLLFWVFVAARGLAPAAASRGYSPVAVHRCLIAAASPVAEHRL